MRPLNIESSPRGLKSASIAISNAFIEAYRQICPEKVVGLKRAHYPEEVLDDTLNVWDEKLPDFDQEAIGAKYKGVNMEPMDPAERAIWDKIQERAARFQRADRIVLGVPMSNFAYPYKLNSSSIYLGSGPINQTERLDRFEPILSFYSRNNDLVATSPVLDPV